MSDYDYLNARIRGMSGHLFTPDFYELVLAAEGEGALIDSLLASTYGPALTDALSSDRGVAAVESALRTTLFETFAKVREMAPEKPLRLLSGQFHRWDVENIRTIFRGKSSAAADEDIVSALFPAGELDPFRLTELVAEQDVLAVADALVIMAFPGAFELRKIIRSPDDCIDLAAIDITLSAEFFSWAADQASGSDPNEQLIMSQLKRQIDLSNVMAVLQEIRQCQADAKSTRHQVIPHGSLSSVFVAKLATCGTLDEAFGLLATTYFSLGIERGILSYGERRRLGVMERFLERVVIEFGCKMFRGDPLGIGVAAGFIWRKYNEFLNLRILLRGKAYGRSPAGIREELLIV